MRFGDDDNSTYALGTELVKGHLAYFGPGFQSGVDHGALDLDGVVEGGGVTAVKLRQYVPT
jgi:hypothetical protein